MLQRLKRFFIGRKALQPFFERLFRVALSGMNYGVGGMVSSSGEINIIKLLNKRYAGKDCMIFDIGANNGEYASMLLKECTLKHTIHSFEPSAFSYKGLSGIFKGSPGIFIHQLALSDKKGSADLYYDVEGTTFASMNKADYESIDVHLNKTERIETITLDEFCATAGITKIHFCKIDVEGHELNVLKGAAGMLTRNNIDMIQFEFGLASSFSGSYLKDFFRILSNYNIYRVLQNGIHRIEYNERYEVFLTTNYLAINRSVDSNT